MGAEIYLPHGLELTTVNNTTFTLHEIVLKKMYVNQVIQNSKKHAQEAISDENVIFYIILHEVAVYSEQQTPMHVLQMYDIITVILTPLPPTLSPSEFVHLCSTGNTSTQSCSADHCPICTEPFQASVLRLLCHHCYHSRCIELWLVQESRTCPICRQTVTV